MAPLLWNDDHRFLLYVGSAFVLVAVVVLRSSTFRLAHIPTVGGPSLPLLSYLGTFRFIRNSRGVFQEGYDKYKGRVFKVAGLDRWLVMVTGPQLMEELRKMPDNQMSFNEALWPTFETDHTMGKELRLDPYHSELVKNNLTKNLGEIFPELVDEIVAAFDDYLPSQAGDWVAVPAMDMIRNVVCRATNRVFVSAPKCRDPAFIALNIRFTIDVIKSRKLLNLCPTFLKPLAGAFLTTVPGSIKEGRRHLDPIIAERQRRMKDSGPDYPDKPNDMLSWLLDHSFEHPTRSSPRELTIRILVLNFAAIHTSSNTFAHALYTLAALPIYMKPLREEVDAVTREFGWTKAAMGHLRKVDSFVKECTRMNTLNGFSIMRVAMQPHTFLDGTSVPAGTFVAAPTTATHMDARIHAHAGVFDPFRFSDKRDADAGGDASREQFAATSLDYIAFGHGKHACPGRFFAAAELKLMLAYVVRNFDVRTEEAGVRPENVYFGVTTFPNPDAKLLFRRRKD